MAEVRPQSGSPEPTLRSKRVTLEAAGLLLLVLVGSVASPSLKELLALSLIHI